MVEQQLTWSKVLAAKVKHKEQNKETTVKNVLSLAFRSFPHGRTKVSYFDAWKIDRYLERGGYNAVLGTPRDISHEIFVDYHSRLEGILKSLDVLDYNGDSKDFPRGLNVQVSRGGRIVASQVQDIKPEEVPNCIGLFACLGDIMFDMGDLCTIAPKLGEKPFIKLAGRYLQVNVWYEQYIFEYVIDGVVTLSNHIDQLLEVFEVFEYDNYEVIEQVEGKLAQLVWFYHNLQKNEDAVREQVKKYSKF
jgi:hypothetical protein